MAAGWKTDWDAARPQCMREALRVVHHREDAEEAVQEAFLRAWRHRDSCRSRQAWMAWLLRITHNEALRVATRRSRRRQREVPEGSSPEQAGDDLELVRVVGDLTGAQMLGKLAEQDRRLLYLRYFHDLSQADVARRLGVPEGTVKVRLHRIRKRLRGAWEG